jgi:hypothetical protein
METLSRREREVLEVIDCSGDDIDVAAIAGELDISSYTLRDKIKSIRRKLDAGTDVWMENLPDHARSKGVKIEPCPPDDMPDDGTTRMDGTTSNI